MKILPKQTIVWDLKLLYTTDVVEKINGDVIVLIWKWSHIY